MCLVASKQIRWLLYGREVGVSSAKILLGTTEKTAGLGMFAGSLIALLT